MRDSANVRFIFEDAILFANRGLLILLLEEGYTAETLTKLHPSFEIQTPLDAAKTNGDPIYIPFMKSIGFIQEHQTMFLSLEDLLNLA